MVSRGDNDGGVEVGELVGNQVGGEGGVAHADHTSAHPRAEHLATSCNKIIIS